MIVSTAPSSPVAQGDIVVRPKKSGFGYHYGTGLSNGLVKDNTPEHGKHVTTFEGFHDGLPAMIIRPLRSPLENAIVEERALSNLGDPYNAGNDNCEHDMSFAQTGISSSQTAKAIVGIGLALSLVALVKD